MYHVDPTTSLPGRLQNRTKSLCRKFFLKMQGNSLHIIAESSPFLVSENTLPYLIVFYNYQILYEHIMIFYILGSGARGLGPGCPISCSGSLNRATGAEAWADVQWGKNFNHHSLPFFVILQDFGIIFSVEQIMSEFSV